MPRFRQTNDGRTRPPNGRSRKKAVEEYRLAASLTNVEALRKQFTSLSLIPSAPVDGVNWTNRSLPYDAELNAIATDGAGTIVAVGSDNSLGRYFLVSTDGGSTWTTPAITQTGAYSSVTYGGGLFAAVGSSGTIAHAIITSPDGITWTTRTNPASAQYDSVAYGNGMFVAARGNRVTYSADGTTWSTLTVSGMNLISVTFGNGTFVGVEPAASTNAAWTSTNGTSWTERVTPNTGSPTWTKVAYGNSLFVAVAGGGSSGRVMTSPDGTTWTLRTTPGTTIWNGIAYGNGLWVAVGNSGAVMTSPDGTTWTARAAAHVNHLSDVVYASGLWLAVNSQMTVVGSPIVRSVDPTVGWVYQPLALSRANFTCVAFGDGVLVALATNSLTYGVSTDGITWTPYVLPNTSRRAWTSITYGGGQFVAVSDDTSAGSQVMTSPDGITWTARTSALQYGWQKVAYGNGLFIAVASTGAVTTTRIMTSPDGITWTSRTHPSTSLRSVAYGNGLWVACGTTGDIMTSPDGSTWTSRTGGGSGTLVDVAYGNNLWLIVYTNGGTVRSANGTTWTLNTMPVSTGNTSVIYADTLWIVVNDNATNGRVMTSPDGVNWTQRTTPTSPAQATPQCVVWTGAKLVAVGGSGIVTPRVITSP